MEEFDVMSVYYDEYDEYDVLCYLGYKGWTRILYIDKNEFYDYFMKTYKKPMSLADFETGQYGRTIEEVARGLVLKDEPEDKFIERVFKKAPDISEASPFTRLLFNEIINSDNNMIFVEPTDCEYYEDIIGKPLKDMIKDLKVDLKKFDISESIVEVYPEDEDTLIILYGYFQTCFKWDRFD